MQVKRKLGMGLGLAIVITATALGVSVWLSVTHDDYINAPSDAHKEVEKRVEATPITPNFHTNPFSVKLEITNNAPVDLTQARVDNNATQEANQ